MPELNVIHIAMMAAATLGGIAAGWVLRDRRSSREKAAVSAGWQEQIAAQRTEHDRLMGQSRALMDQISQYQASNTDAKNRAKELSTAVRDAYARRDDLQREIKDVRGNLEMAVQERNQLRSDISSIEGVTANTQLKDARINKLQLELDNWQNRLPPLIEKFRQRNGDAVQLEADLTVARTRIAELEESAEIGQTRIEPVIDPNVLTDGREACNDPSDPIVEENKQTEDESPLPQRDKLQAIKGIGPAIERTLHELGIFRFQQIADMGEYDIDRIANRLKGFRSRIYREDWVGQARELRDQQSGD